MTYYGAHSNTNGEWKTPRLLDENGEPVLLYHATFRGHDSDREMFQHVGRKLYDLHQVTDTFSEGDEIVIQAESGNFARFEVTGVHVHCVQLEGLDAPLYDN